MSTSNERNEELIFKLSYSYNKARMERFFKCKSLYDIFKELKQDLKDRGYN